MQYNRSYSGSIVIDKEDALHGGPHPGIYTGKAYLQHWRKWKGREKTAVAKYAFIAAFRRAGTSFYMRSLQGYLNDESLSLIGPEERALLLIYGDLVCHRPDRAREKLAAFEK